jgi:hypothetical protein
MCDDLLGTSLPDVDTLDMAGSERYGDIRQQTWSKLSLGFTFGILAKASKQDPFQPAWSTRTIPADMGEK